MVSVARNVHTQKFPGLQTSPSMERKHHGIPSTVHYTSTPRSGEEGDSDDDDHSEITNALDHRQDEEKEPLHDELRVDASDTEWTIDEYESVRILGEVVSASLEGVTDINPYCIIKAGGNFLHKTLPAEGSTPTWTLSTRSVFLWETTPRDLALSDLEINIWYKEQNLTATARCLGKVALEASTVLAEHCDEERFTVALQKSLCHGTVTLRFRLATDMDQAFVDDLYFEGNSHRKKKVNAPWKETRPTAAFVTETTDTEAAKTGITKTITSVFHSRAIRNSEGDRKFRVKPSCDPKDKERTKYMTKREMKDATFSPSHEWVMAGSGSTGHLYLEILKCDGLPNVDVGESIGNLTDAFVCAVFEDVMVQTPVIDDELSPHWLPWTQRAFCIRIMHPASLLYLGAFDFDYIGDHDPLGRVAVNLSNLQHNTDYTLTYNLYPSSNVTDRTAAGNVTIRIRIEYHDEKAALLAGLRRRPKCHVNVTQERSFQVLNYTCHGEYGDQYEEKFDLTIIRSYINEILEYKNALGYCLVDSFRSLVFWRGQVKALGMDLPLHSLFFFLSCCKMIERPALALPFGIMFAGWMLLATLTQRRQHPSPWNGCPSFGNYLDTLLGLPPKPPFQRIEPNQGKEEGEAYEQAWKDRIARDTQRAQENWERQQELDNIGNENIHTKMDKFGIPLELMNRLTNIQAKVAKYCRYMRIIKILATWEEGVISFWIAAGLFGGGFVLLMLPWEFILTWLSRLVVYGCLGPHMMVVDVFLNDASTSDDKLIEKALEEFQKESESARHRRQDALKLKDAKCLAFGKYVTLVPSFNISRHFDRPLPCSFAEHSPEPKLKHIHLSDRVVPGQQFFGTIVPRTETQTAEFEDEVKDLDEFRVAVNECVQSIKENESSDVLKRLREKSCFFEERNMPASVGYEMIATKPTPNDTGDKSELQVMPPPEIVLSTSDAMSASGPRRRRRSALFKAEQTLLQAGGMKHNRSFLKPVAEDVVHVDSANGLAIVQTFEERRRLIPTQSEIRQSSSFADESAIRVCATEDEDNDMDSTCGFETIWTS